MWKWLLITTVSRYTLTQQLKDIFISKTPRKDTQRDKDTLSDFASENHTVSNSLKHALADLVLIVLGVVLKK